MFCCGLGQKVYDEAKALYEALSRKLGSNEYFFGDRPSTLDAYAYGFLLTQLVPDVPSRQLHFLISRHDNLGTNHTHPICLFVSH
jgi:metaxin